MYPVDLILSYYWTCIFLITLASCSSTQRSSIDPISTSIREDCSIWKTHLTCRQFWYDFDLHRSCCPVSFFNFPLFFITKYCWKDQWEFRRSSEKFQTQVQLSSNIFYWSSDTRGLTYWIIFLLQLDSTTQNTVHEYSTPTCQHI